MAAHAGQASGPAVPGESQGVSRRSGQADARSGDWTLRRRSNVPIRCTSALIDRARRTTADLIVKDTHHHSLGKRTFLTNTDWELIRACPVPLLLTKSSAWASRPASMCGGRPRACERQAGRARQPHRGPRRARGEEAGRRTAPAARLLARGDRGSGSGRESADGDDSLGGRSGARGGAEARACCRTSSPSTESRRATCTWRWAGRRQFCRVRRANCRPTSWSWERSRAAGLRRVFIGSTAEDVLERLPCDALIVRPPDFADDLPF